MRIITNADDFGQDEDTVRATIECFENGSLTSATIMPKMVATDAAAAFAARHPELSFGVHLTYVLGDNTERPISDPAMIPDLVGPDGRFRESNQTRLRGILRRIPVAQIARETEAQLSSLRDRGVRISHVDSHGHLHRYAQFRAALELVLPRFGIRKVRSVQDIYLRRPLKSPNYWLGSVWRRGIRARFVTTDHFYMPTSAGDTLWWGPLLDRFARDSTRSIEVGVHPGFAEPWRAAERVAVAEFAAEARRRGQSLIGWNDL